MNAHSPIVSEFASDEEQAAYEKWLAAKVAASLADGDAPTPHEQLMAEVRAIIAKAGKPAQC